MKRIMLMNIKQTTINIIHSSQLTDFLACCSKRSDSSLSFSKFWSAILRECDSVCGAKRANSISLTAARSGSFLQERKGSTAGRCCPQSPHSNPTWNQAAGFHTSALEPCGLQNWGVTAQHALPGCPVWSRSGQPECCFWGCEPSWAFPQPASPACPGGAAAQHPAPLPTASHLMSGLCKSTMEKRGFTLPCGSGSQVFPRFYTSARQQGPQSQLKPLYLVSLSIPFKAYLEFKGHWENSSQSTEHWNEKFWLTSASLCSTPQNLEK